MWSVVMLSREQAQHPRALHVHHRRRLGRHVLEVGGQADVGRLRIPGVGGPFRHVETVPVRVAREHVGVLALEHLRAQAAQDRLLDFLAARPDVLEIDRLAVLARAQRLGLEVEVDPAGQGVGHHQRRRGQVVGPHVGVDPAFEVAVAGKHRRRHQVALVDRLRDRLGQRAAVADAGRAAVAHEVETELVQIRREPGLAQVFGDDLGARRQAGLDPRLDRQAFLHRFLGDQARRHHHRRVGGVGAARDGRDDHGAVPQLARGRSHRGGRGGRGTTGRTGRGHRLQLLEERALHVAEPHPVLRPARTGQAGLDRAEIELQRVGVDRIRRVRRMEEALLLHVGLDQRDPLRRPAGEPR